MEKKQPNLKIIPIWNTDFQTKVTAPEAFNEMIDVLDGKFSVLWERDFPAAQDCQQENSRCEQASGSGTSETSQNKVSKEVMKNIHHNKDEPSTKKCSTQTRRRSTIHSRVFVQKCK